MSLSRCFYGARIPSGLGLANRFPIYQSVILRKTSNCIFGVLSERPRSPLLRRVITKSWNLLLLDIFWHLLKWQGRLFKMLCDCFFWTRTFLPGEGEAPKTCSRNSMKLGMLRKVEKMTGCTSSLPEATQAESCLWGSPGMQLSWVALMLRKMLNEAAAFEPPMFLQATLRRTPTTNSKELISSANSTWVE